MPKRGRPRRTTPVMPFSLILEPAELELLRKYARREGTSVGEIVRRALYIAIFQHVPEFAEMRVEAELNAFLDRVSRILPGREPSKAVRAKLKRQVVRGLLK